MRLPRLRSVIAVGAIVAGALTLSTPAAFALPISERTIKSECKSAGGTYSTSMNGGFRFSACSYHDDEGNRYTDYYLDGDYYSTQPG